MMMMTERGSAHDKAAARGEALETRGPFHARSNPVFTDFPSDSKSGHFRKYRARMTLQDHA
jgi:hypothetical protein